jgi:hypothetical protein
VARKPRRKIEPLPALKPKWAWSVGRVFLLIGFGLSSLGLWMVWQEWDAHNRYVEIAAVVVDRRVNNSSGGPDNPNSFRPELLLRYSVGNSRFHSWVSAEATPAGSGLSGEALAQARINAFTIGESYPCWYTPEHPERVVLARSYSWSWYLGFGLVGLGLVVAGFGSRYRRASHSTL